MLAEVVQNGGKSGFCNAKELPSGCIFINFYLIYLDIAFTNSFTAGAGAPSVATFVLLSDLVPAKTSLELSNVALFSYETHQDAILSASTIIKTIYLPIWKRGIDDAISLVVKPSDE